MAKSESPHGQAVSIVLQEGAESPPGWHPEISIEGQNDGVMLYPMLQLYSLWVNYVNTGHEGGLVELIVIEDDLNEIENV